MRSFAAGILAALAPALAHGAPEQLKGSRFIEVMQDNTLSGTTSDGAAYNLYFLPGGEVTYDDSTGARDRGRWSMDSGGDVCISFEQIDDARAQCYVEVDGSTVHGGRARQAATQACAAAWSRASSRRSRPRSPRARATPAAR